MKKWQQYRVRKNYQKQIAAKVEDTLDTIVQQSDPSYTHRHTTEPTVFERLVTTLDDINDSNATREQKIAISINLVEVAPITDQEKATLAEQIEQVYEISATE